MKVFWFGIGFDTYLIHFKIFGPKWSWYQFSCPKTENEAVRTVQFSVPLFSPKIFQYQSSLDLIPSIQANLNSEGNPSSSPLVADLAFTCQLSWLL